MLKHRISRVLVMDRDQISGIVTKKDIGYRLRRQDPTWRRRSNDNDPVSLLMTKDIFSMSPDSSIHDALMLMFTHHISGFPVIDQGMILGIVTKSDVLKAPFVKKLDLPVKEVMHDVSSVTLKHSIDHVIDLMIAGTRSVVVTSEDGSLAGIISESDLTFGQEGRNQLYKLCAGDIMRSPVITLQDTARTGDVVSEMVSKRISSLILMNEQGIKGIITRDDIIREVVQ
jgi:CBS domain-containing protein